MANRLTTIQELHDYFSGIVERAEHHAQKVEEIIYPLLGMIIAYKDSGTEIDVSGHQSGTGNLLWVKINGTRYAFRYDHLSVSIEIRKGSYKGKRVETINNGTTLSTLCSVFKGL